MTKEYKKFLIGIGREDIVADNELQQSGYAGIDGEGNLVDRRLHPGATPLKACSKLGIPKPKEIKSPTNENDTA